ncbi:MAG: GNAT family N-acetyltransferase [Fidelibacterota bacterium]
MKIRVKQIRGAEDLALAHRIRTAVFIGEQKVPPEIEMDEFEDSATHILAWAGNEPVGTARWRQTPDGVKLERFAVLKPYRSRGVGSALVQYCLEENAGSIIYLNAQVDVIDFYRQYGFREIGDEFEEAGIRHKQMILAT